MSKSIRIVPIRLALASCLVFAAAGWAGAQAPPPGLVIFGTSLSDPGNAYALIGEQGTPPDYMMGPLLIPTVPYARGGHHLSNGPTWVEQYGRSVGLGENVRPALASANPGATNFAVGAARARQDGVNFNLENQVSTFLGRVDGVASPQSLYVIEMGSNDVRDAFGIYLAGGNGGSIIQQALSSIAVNVQHLYMAGARHFLIWNVPNIALTPAGRMLGPAAAVLGTQVTVGFNVGLTQTLGPLGLLPGATFTTFDAFGALTAITANPTAFNLTNVTSACVTPDVAPFACTNPDDYLFWDGIHPTKAGHAILAGVAAQLLQ